MAGWVECRLARLRCDKSYSTSAEPHDLPGDWEPDAAPVFLRREIGTYDFKENYCFSEYVTRIVSEPKKDFNSSAVFPSTFPSLVYDHLLLP